MNGPSMTIVDNTTLLEETKNEKAWIPTITARTAHFGAHYSHEETSFRVWAPTRPSVTLRLYTSDDGEAVANIPMENVDGVYTAIVPGDWKGAFYTFEVQGKEVVDPYSVSCSINGRRSAVVDLSETDPPGFRDTSYVKISPADAIIYEMHVGDYSFSTTSGARYRGKYLGVTENSSYHAIETGIGHLKALGVTHVHLMPIFKNFTVDERPERVGAEDNYNWGYDPHLFNVPEGSYATDPYDPTVRIRELKAMIQALHEADIGVVMDVVYNHTYRTEDSEWNQLVPDYYYRKVDGAFANGSGVGNEIASERIMVRKFILESLSFWQKEYKIDGFRFDLMALLDQTTVRLLMERLRRENPYALIYGEPWYGAPTPLPEEERTTWGTQNDANFALFNARFRDALCGDINGASRGFVQGNTEAKQWAEVGLLGSIRYSKAYNGGAKDPIHSLNYFSAHDNLILEDKLSLSLGNREHNEAMTRLAFGFLLTAEGIPFFHAGNEFRRSKAMLDNSYRAPYLVNGIDWREKAKHRDLFHYVQDLIALRKAYPVFRLRSKEDVAQRVHILGIKHPSVIGMVYQRGDLSERKYLVTVYHSGWWNLDADTTVLFDALYAERLCVQRVFDRFGRTRSNRVELDRRAGIHLQLEPISMLVFEVEVLY